MQTAEIEKLYTAYAGDIYRYSMYKLHNTAEAEDVVAEVFARFMESNADKKIANMKLWLLGFARNIIYSKYQKEQKLSHIDTDEWLTQADETVDLANETITDEIVADVRAAIQKLEPTEQEIVTLKIWEELSFKEIAKLINHNENTVKAIYYRSLDKMKRKLEKNYKQLNVITLPLLVAAIAKLKLDIAIPTTLSNLVNFQNMDAIQTGPEMVTQASTSGLKGLLATTKGKIIAGVVAAALVTGVAGTGVYLYGQSGGDDDNNPNVTPTVSETVTPTEATTDPYAGWNTYKNEAFGISVRYPDSFVLAEGGGELTKNDYFSLRSTLQGADSQLLNLEFRNDEPFDPTDIMTRETNEDFTLEISNHTIEFLGYVYGDGGPRPDGTGVSDIWFAAVANYNQSIQLVHSRNVSTIYTNPENPTVVTETKPTDEELRIGKLILQSIRELNVADTVTYENSHLGITMQVPASWKIEDSYTPAVPPTQGAIARVKISNANGTEIANIFPYFGGFGWCDEYEGTGNPDIKLSFTKEELTIAGKVEVLEGCYYNGVYAESLIIVFNDSINEWEGYYLEVTKSGESELATIKEVLRSISY